MAAAPRMTVTLDWDGDLRFRGSVDETLIAVDGDAVNAASPVQLLATGLAGCMAIDVVHILAKMRTPAASLSTDLIVERAPSDPRRVVAATMNFTVTGDVPEKNVQRALDMSHETYCSVWHSLRQDIAFETTFDVRPAS